MSPRPIRPIILITGALLLALVAATRVAPLQRTVAGTRAEQHEQERIVYRGVTACGVERWAVKTGIDPGVRRVNTSRVVPNSIYALRRISPPPGLDSLPWNQRHAPVETTVYGVSGMLLRYKMESDSDFHLVLADTGGRTMIVEIPAPQCVGSSSPFAAQIRTVRRNFISRFHPTVFWHRVQIPIQIVGVGFFDFMHGQSGVAPNGIELHPVLRILFSSGPTTAPPVVPLPPAPKGRIAVSARVSNPSPTRYTDVTVIGRITAGGRGVPGVSMETSWHYRTRSVGCSGTTDSSGTARCTRGIGRATAGYPIRIDVTFSLGGQSYSTGTSFTPQ